MIDRSRRRIRLRTTAPPARRPTAYPTLGGSAGSLGTQVTVTVPRRTRRPSARSSAKAARPRSRPGETASARRAGGPLRPTACDDPCAGARTGSLDRRGSTSGAGTRGAWRAFGCWADRDVSRMASPRGTRAARSGARRLAGPKVPTRVSRPATGPPRLEKRCKSTLVGGGARGGTVHPARRCGLRSQVPLLPRPWVVDCDRPTPRHEVEHR